MKFNILQRPFILLAIVLTLVGGYLVLPRNISKINIKEISAVDEESKPTLPDLSSMTVENVVASAPVFKQGKVEVATMLDIPAMREFVKNNGRIQSQRLSQMRVKPLAIIIKEGDYDLNHLYEEVVRQTNENVISRMGNTYLFRVPILVERPASLTISGFDGSEVFLSKERATFIANAGRLYILGTKVTGWSEKEGKPSRFKKATDIRPFIVTWSGSQLYIASSKISHLGHRKGKAYGVTYSSCPDCLEVDSTLPRPTGKIIDSTFTDLYYGFYSYEADDVAIVGNTYANNVVYGIDPHDRSNRLIIANNDCYGTGKKHGIIISREVNDSWIFGNKSHDNHGSGIMLDRNSTNNVIAFNKIYNNKQDGLTFFESPNNTTWKNEIYKNKRSGIRARNSWDLKFLKDDIANHAEAAIVLYTDDISVKNDRDLKVDPFSLRADALVQGAHIISPDAPVFKFENTDKVTLSNVDALSSDTLLWGEPPLPTKFMSALSSDSTALVIQNKFDFLSAPTKLLHSISNNDQDSEGDDVD